MNEELHVTSVAHTESGRRCAVIFNPTKISDQFHVLMEENLHRRGWTGTLWLETSAEDPGRAMTQQAIAKQADLVIAAAGSFVSVSPAARSLGVERRAGKGTGPCL